MSVPATTMTADLEQAIAEFEARSDLLVCVYDLSACFEMDGKSLLLRDRALHRHPHCMHVKKRKHPECIRCHKKLNVARCEEARGVFTFTCHANASEVAVPVFVDEQLLCVGFVGPFCRETATRGGLRGLADREVRQLETWCKFLQGFLLAQALRLKALRRSQAVGSLGRMEEFLDEHVAENPSLEDLAMVVARSVTRTGHLVKELTGKSFRELKDQRRLARARNLLARTNAKLTFVANRSGFGDADYFCRFFKKKAGITPGEYRRKFGHMNV